MSFTPTDRNSDGKTLLTWRNVVELLEHVYPVSLTDKQISEALRSDMNLTSHITRAAFEAGEIGRNTPYESRDASYEYFFVPEKDR